MRPLSSVARLTLAALAVSSAAVCGTPQASRAVRFVVAHGHARVCDARRPSRSLLRVRFPATAERPVLRDIFARWQRESTIALDDNDDAIQTDAPASAMASCDAGVPVLAPIAMLASPRRVVPQHLRSSRRAPRGPPSLLT